jgi:hypothetical protein
MTASRSSPIAESANRIDTDAQVRRAGIGELATMLQRLRAKRAQKRREAKGIQSMATDNREPTLVEVVGHPDGQTMLCPNYVARPIVSQLVTF